MEHITALVSANTCIIAFVVFVLILPLLSLVKQALGLGVGSNIYGRH